MKRIALVSLALMIMLGVMGAGYAEWKDSVTIIETVSTGEVKVGIRNVSTDDAGAALDPGYDPVTKVFKTYTKHVATTTSKNGPWKCNHKGVGFYESVTETIINGYPSYAPTMVLQIANCGSIPVILNGIDEKHAPYDLTWCVEVVSWELKLNGEPFEPEKKGSGWLELGGALFGIQLHSCDVLEVTITKHIRQDEIPHTEPEDDAPGVPADGGISDPCPMNGSTTWTETVSFIQWNKYVAQ